MTFLPVDFKMPTSSNYLKFQDGKNKFRILSDAIVGWEYWTTDKKPIRSRTEFKDTPNIGDNVPKFFIAFIVWNYQDKKVQILEITQKTIIHALNTFMQDEDWGEPSGYDITVNRSGSGMETEYTVTPKDAELAKEIEEAYEARSINLEALYDGADPFTTEKAPAAPHKEKMKPAFDKTNYPKPESDDVIPF